MSEALPIRRLRSSADQRRIDPAAEKSAERNIAFQLSPNSGRYEIIGAIRSLFKRY